MRFTASAETSTLPVGSLVLRYQRYHPTEGVLTGDLDQVVEGITGDLDAVAAAACDWLETHEPTGRGILYRIEGPGRTTVLYTVGEGQWARN